MQEKKRTLIRQLLLILLRLVPGMSSLQSLQAPALSPDFDWQLQASFKKIHVSFSCLHAPS